MLKLLDKLIDKVDRRPHRRGFGTVMADLDKGAVLFKGVERDSLFSEGIDIFCHIGADIPAQYDIAVIAHPQGVYCNGQVVHILVKDILQPFVVGELYKKLF